MPSGDRIECLVSARNRSDAMRRLMTNEEFRNFVGGDKPSDISVEGVDIEPKPMSVKVSACGNKRGWYMAENVANGVTVEWKAGRFNDTARAVDVTGSDAAAAATAVREIGDYLAEYFASLI